MATVHGQSIGDKVILPRAELERLVELARHSEPIELQLDEQEMATLDMMRLAEEGGAFDFWKEEGEDIYSAEDGEPI
jgi:hypothetical protein